MKIIQLRGEGECVVCGKKTEAKMIRYCEKCYEKEENKKRKEDAMQEYHRLFAASNISARAHNVFLDKIRPTRGQKDIVEGLLNSIEEFNHDRWGLPYLFGEVGTGKSLLSMSSASTAMLNKGASAFYVHIPDLMNDIEYYRKNKDRILGCDFLIMDDLGHHNVSDYTVNLLFTILNDRMAGNHGTMIVSNFSIEGFIEKIVNDGTRRETANAIRDRISSMCLPVELVGENVRLRKATERAWKSKK